MTSFKPAWLFWNGELRHDLALHVDANGRIQGASATLDGATVHLSGRAMFPGLVNCHSHAFQRLIRGRTEYVAAGHGSDDFWSWRELMYQAASSLDPDALYTVSLQVFVEMALAGITTVGEFHYLHHQPDGTPYANRNELAHQVIRAARDVGLRIALLRVGYARAGYQVAENPRQRRFIDADPETWIRAVEDLGRTVQSDSAVSVGYAPHSVRAVTRHWLEAVKSAPTRVIHMHVSEQPAEIKACLAEHGKRPVAYLRDIGLLGPTFTAVHAVHLAEDEIQLLGTSGSSVCACPSTERNLGDGVVPADLLAAAGASLCFGSDSQATVDLLEDARELESHLRLVRQRRGVLDPGGGMPDGLGTRLLQYATRNGGKSLGLDVGELKPGSPADFFTVDLNHPSVVGAASASLIPTVVFGADKGAIREVAVAGRFVVKDGVHPLQEKAGQDYAALCRRLP